jgi:hypothetical protein
VSDRTRLLSSGGFCVRSAPAGCWSGSLALQCVFRG